MDYPGECREFGLITDILGPRCSQSKCQSLPSTDCQRITPPGACCPICSGALTIVYSKKQIDRALYALRGKNTESLTLKSVFRSLENLVQISQCRLSGFLSVENDIFISVQSTEKQPSFIQIEVCSREAEKIATLISIQSHRVTSELSLSALTVATIVKSSTSNSLTNSFSLVLVLFLNVFLVTR